MDYIVLDILEDEVKEAATKALEETEDVEKVLEGYIVDDEVA